MVEKSISIDAAGSHDAYFCSPAFLSTTALAIHVNRSSNRGRA